LLEGVNRHIDKAIAEIKVITYEQDRLSLDRRISQNAPVVVKVGEIISNSIRINELIPRKMEIDETYLLIGAAKGANG
jgi:hypothetical protein